MVCSIQCAGLSHLCQSFYPLPLPNSLICSCSLIIESIYFLNRWSCYLWIKTPFQSGCLPPSLLSFPTSLPSSYPPFALFSTFFPSFSLAFLLHLETLVQYSWIEHPCLVPDLREKAFSLSKSQLSGQESACQCRRHKRSRLIPGLARSLREGNGNPLQYSCLENLMDHKAWWAIVQGVAKSLTRLSTHSHTFPLLGFLLAVGFS